MTHPTTRAHGLGEPSSRAGGGGSSPPAVGLDQGGRLGGSTKIQSHRDAHGRPWMWACGRWVSGRGGVGGGFCLRLFKWKIKAASLACGSIGSWLC